jgi:hypothetical protein
LPPNVGLELSDGRYLKEACKMPLCLNLKYDTVFFDGAGERLWDFELFRWLEYISTTAPDVFSSIRMLEFRNVRNGIRLIPMYSHFLFLAQFPSLQTLSITLLLGEHSDDDIKEIVREAEQWLGNGYDPESGPRRKIEVIVRRWEPLSVGPLVLREG